MSQWVKTLSTNPEFDPQDPQSEQSLESYPLTPISTKPCASLPSAPTHNEMH